MAKIRSEFATYMVVSIACSYGFLFVISLFLQKPIYLVQFFHFGLDYHAFFQAARDVITQHDPYLNARVVTPPLSALINIPLAVFDEHVAATIFFIANIFLTFSAITLAQKQCNLAVTQRLSIFVLAFLSAPTLMLFERGNIDGVVAFLVAGTIFYLLKRPLISGILLSAGILIKLYPLIILFPILIQRHLRVVICCTVATLAILFALHDLFISFFWNAMSRVATSRISENLSPFTFLFVVGAHLLPDTRSTQIALKSLYYAAIISIFAFGFLKDIKWSSVTCSDIKMRAIVASYLVFVINVPGLVYLYSGVMIILMMIYMLEPQLIIGRYTLMTLFLGSFFVFFPARSFDLTLGETRYSHFFNYFPPAGSAILLCFFIALRLEGIKAATKE